MERSIIQKFQQLKVLSNFDYQRMDELVQDLATALEESSHGNSEGKARKRRGMKRRSKQNGMISTNFQCVSEDSESSFDEEALHLKESFDSAQHLTDSDDVTRNNCVSMGLLHYLKKQSPHGGGNFIESDSVNENFSPIRPHRRKRKFKRMAIDPIPSILMSEHEQMKRKSKSLKLLKYCGGIENFYQNLKSDSLHSSSCGKRKRSMRERSVELATEMSMSTNFEHPNCSKQGEHVFLEPRQRRDDAECSMMDCSEGAAMMTSKTITESSSSSLSSSESDAGVYTNDEGREGDDEQSDYFESGPACGVSGVVPWWESENIEKSMDNAMDPEFHAILTGSFQHMSWNVQQAFRSRVSNLEVPKREIRAGRRRLHDLRPGFSIMTSFNEKISKFLQDPEQNELRLHPVRKKERNQLNSLASLYSLSMRTEGSSNNTYPVLSKTRNTMQAVNVQPTPSSILSIGDIKRRRKTPPSSPVSEAFVGENSNPVDESFVGNQMLHNMGWEPKASETESQGMPNPVSPVVRPKLQGHGCSGVADKTS